MSDIGFVFGIIKEQCTEAGIPDKTCFATIKKISENDDIFIPVYTCLTLLEDNGLIRFNRQTKEITLTEKGINSDSLFDFPIESPYNYL